MISCTSSGVKLRSLGASSLSRSMMLTSGWSRKKSLKYLLLLERTTLWARRTWPLQTREMSTYWPVLRYSLSAENTVLRCSASKQLMMSEVE